MKTENETIIKRLSYNQTVVL